MLDLYEEYNSQEEREGAVMMEQAEIQLDKAILAFETAEQMSELAMREAECRLIMESGEVTDLAEYYEEATNETEEKKKGVIQKIWEGILNIIGKIKDFLLGSARKKADPNGTSEVDESFFERHKKLGAVVKALKDFFAHPIAKFATVLVAATGAVALFLAIKKTGKTKKAKNSEINKAVDEAEEQLNFIQKAVKNIFHKDLDKDAEGAPSVIGKVTKAIGDFIKEGVHAVLSAPSKVKNSINAKKQQNNAAAEYAANGGAIDESADDDIFGDDFEEDAYAEDAGDLSDIAELLATL